MKNKGSILITGASSGIGKYATQILAERGWIVWAGYRSDLDRESLLKLHSNNILPIKIDVTDIDLILSARKTIKEKGIELKCLINNAGIALGGPLEILEMDEIRKVFEVNVFGLIQMTQTFLPLLRESSGRVINISSVSGLFSVPFLMPYSASKYAVEAISDSLRGELNEQKIKVSIIEPGPIKTSIWKTSLHWSEKVLEQSNDRLKWYQPKLDHFLASIKKHDREAMPVEKLNDSILHAVESKNPKIRYLIYPGSFFFRLILKCVPDRLKDIIIKLSLK